MAGFVWLRTIRDAAAFVSCGAAWRHNPQPELGQQSLIRSPVLDLLRCPGMILPVHGTSDYTGIRTCHVFRPGIEPGSTPWKSRTLIHCISFDLGAIHTDRKALLTFNCRDITYTSQA